jgi:repressor LexA
MGYKIAEARKAKGWNQQKLAEMMGTTQQQIARWETGQRDPKADVVIKLSALLGVTVSYLLGVDDDSAFVEAVPARSYDVPVVGKIAAGAAREAIEQAGEYMQTTECMYNRHPNAFWLVVSGNSMNRLFPDGALVLIDPDEEVRNGDVAALFVNGDDATIKRVYFDGTSVSLVPESYDPEYFTRVIDRNDPDSPMVRMIGKAVGYTSPMNWRP